MYEFGKYLQFNVLKRFVADGTPGLTFLLVLFILVYGATMLRGCKHKKRKNTWNDPAERETEIGWKS